MFSANLLNLDELSSALIFSIVPNDSARQYGEVVLPDASTVQGPGTLASKLSRCKEGTVQFLPSGYKSLLSITRVAIQV
jgi:hypothetical protein